MSQQLSRVQAVLAQAAGPCSSTFVTVVKSEGISDLSAPTGRRSSRVIVSIPLLISGKREDGTRFEGTAEAVIVNKHGGKIRTTEKLQSGMQIRIAIVSPYRFQM